MVFLWRGRANVLQECVCFRASWSDDTSWWLTLSWCRRGPLEIPRVVCLCSPIFPVLYLANSSWLSFPVLLIQRTPCKETTMFFLGFYFCRGRYDCLFSVLSNVWTLLFHIFVWLFSCIKWEGKSSLSYAILVDRKSPFYVFMHNLWHNLVYPSLTISLSLDESERRKYDSRLRRVQELGKRNPRSGIYFQHLI